jgi:hypothetical protein
MDLHAGGWMAGLSSLRRLLLSLVLAGVSHAAAQVQVAPLDESSRNVLGKGQRIATAIGTVTSAAVSPLLGVCLLGAYEHFRTPPSQRARLPYYTSPWFWIPVSLLLLSIVMKDTIGGVVPLLTKPLDAVEVLLVNKAALVLAVFPVVLHETAKLFGLDSLRAVFALLPDALIPSVYAAPPSLPQSVESAASASLVFATAAIGLMAGFVVWLVAHAIDVLVLLSPFPMVDLLLKGSRTAVFALLAGLTLLDPRIAMVASLVVIVLCLLLAGWAFRIAVFGALFSWDLLRLFVFDRRAEPAVDGVRCFTARRIGRARKRTCGKLRRTPAGGLEFRYRKWLAGPPVSVPLENPAQYEVGRGLFHPSVLRVEKDKYKVAFRCLPRYQRSEERIASVLAVTGIRDIRLGRGLRAFADWMSDDSAEPVEETVAP